MNSYSFKNCCCCCCPFSHGLEKERIRYWQC